MTKIIIEGFFTLSMLIVGAFMVWSRLSNLEDKANTTPLITGLILLLLGLILFVITIRSLIKYLTTHTVEEAAAETIVVKSNNLIGKNNDMVNDWNKTNETRDKLKILQIQSNGGSGEE